jgi:hypothetical protein
MGNGPIHGIGPCQTITGKRVRGEIDDTHHQWAGQIQLKDTTI